VYRHLIRVDRSFDGEVVDPDTLSNPAKGEKFDLPAFLSRNSKDIRFPEIKLVAQALKSQYGKVVGIGYCYGGWAHFQLGANPSLINAISVAHPSGLTREEIENVKVPVQILAPETDPLFTQELKDHANKIIPALNMPYEYVYFPGVAHGFASKGDPNNNVQKDSLERAKRSAVNFFNEFLH
jgi:dienelactone hydrolase